MDKAKKEWIENNISLQFKNGINEYFKNLYREKYQEAIKDKLDSDIKLEKLKFKLILLSWLACIEFLIIAFLIFGGAA